MTLNENDFFREASRRICSHLEIEKAMRLCMQYLEAFIPSDVMFLQLYEFELGSMRTVAKATVSEGVSLDLITALPEMSREALESWDYPEQRTLRS
ncbi:MAG: hypothetical protein GY866_15460 [Proteobacteria bacterium]|nr:hypothetical protein [Pseudomonadota bacterium]